MLLVVVAFWRLAAAQSSFSGGVHT